MKSFVIYYTMIHLLQDCSPQCTKYYIMLEESAMTGGGVKLNPISMSTISNKYLSFNSSEIYKTLQNNTDCILEFKNTAACRAKSTTYCTEPPQPLTELTTTSEATEPSHITTKIILPTEASTTANGETEIQATTAGVSFASEINETQTMNTIDNTKSHFTITSETTAIDTTTEVTTDLETAKNDSTGYASSTSSHGAHDGNAMDNKEIAIIAAISTVGAAGLAALAFFAARKLQNVLQYGAYYLPASTQV